MLLENTELIQTAESIAMEKGIEKELVFQAIEKAISKAGKVKYGNDYDIRGNIDRKTGKISLARYLEVKKDIEDNLIEISLKDAKKKQKDIKIGEFIIEKLPDIDIGRISAQIAKQVLVQNIKEAESIVWSGRSVDQRKEYKMKAAKLNINLKEINRWKG